MEMDLRLAANKHHFKDFKPPLKTATRTPRAKDHTTASTTTYYYIKKQRRAGRSKVKKKLFAIIIIIPPPFRPQLIQSHSGKCTKKRVSANLNLSQKYAKPLLISIILNPPPLDKEEE